MQCQVWRRQLSYIDKRSLEVYERAERQGIAFDWLIADRDACAVGRNYYK